MASVFALLIPVPAVALSCLPHSVEGTYQEVADAEESYVVVVGRLEVDVRDAPSNGSGVDIPPQMTKLTGKLLGKSMSQQGFVTPFSQAVTVEVACFASWCGAVQKDQKVLAFVRREGGLYAIGVNPCGGHLFPQPDATKIKQALACYRGASCAPY